MENTTLPIQKMLACYKNENVLDINNYSDIIAMGILFQYLNENLHLFRSKAPVLQYLENIINKFMKNLDAARKILRREGKSVYAEITTTHTIMKQIKMIGDMLSCSFFENMNLNMKWSKGDIRCE